VLEDREWQLSDRQQHYGTNEMAIPVKSVAALIADEMWHPFYVFQYFSIIIWVAGDQYYTYAVCILVITWFSIITSAIETHQNMKRLADIAHFSCMVGVQLPWVRCMLVLVRLGDCLVSWPQYRTCCHVQLARQQYAAFTYILGN
jgi:magnesium-transporting ATPase (P-type)